MTARFKDMASWRRLQAPDRQALEDLGKLYRVDLLPQAQASLGMATRVRCTRCLTGRPRC